ncbi:MAG TPA: carboxypeptidase regulatory-like domain-containing protein, partial [Kofleriaceae bacterium]|nr:carboxypeptidase regulatory-like domain-containing protein [Kofleriaceae bacterium]
TVRLGNALVDPPGDLSDRSGDELAQVLTAADGTFDFGPQAPATFVVSAEAAGKTPAARVASAADPASTIEHLELELGVCRSRLFGQVVDASGGGVARARLRVVGLGGADADTGGNYSLCVPVGDSRIRIDADGYGTVDRPLHLVGELHQDFELVPEAILAGRVVDEAGAGVGFARVLAVPQAIEAPHFLADGHAIADAEGRFRIDSLPPGRFLLAATADGYGTTAPRPAVAASGASAAGAELTIVVARRARVTGTIVMANKPVAGAALAIAAPDLPRRIAYSQADGTFTLEAVPPGPQRLAVQGYDVVAPKELDVRGREVDGVVVEVTQQPSLVGRVLRHDRPVSGATVQTSLGPNATSDGSGRYQIRGLPAGELQVTAQAYGAQNAFSPWTKVSIADGEATEHDIVLDGGAEVHGVVVDASGEPVPDVYVRMIEPKGDLGESMTDAKGAFACTSMLGHATYRVAVFPSPGARTAFAPIGPPVEVPVADGDAVVEGVRVAIAHDVLAISGHVVDDAGAPVADVHVEAVGRSLFAFPFAVLPSVRADADGGFTIENLARGTYTLHAHAGDGSEAELVDVAAGRADVVIKLVRPGTIEGTIAGFSTTPRVHARQLTNTLQLDNDAVVDGNAFSITGLAPGKYVVEALAGDESAGQSVEVTSGAVTRVALESQGKGLVAGTVTEFTTKAPVAGFTCTAAQSMGGQAGDWPQEPARPDNTTDSHGAFQIKAPLGEARVMCFPSDGSYSVAGGDAEVVAGGTARVELKTVKAEPPPSDPGFRIKPLTLPLVIAAVDADGPARAAGLAVGDRLVTIDGRPVAGLLPGAAMMLAWNTRPGTPLVLGVDRAGAPRTITVVPVAQTN